MINEESQIEEINEIGYIARKIDIEMTILERMKIKKSTLKRITIALGIYFVTMFLFLYIL
jgi:hypothetical protein